MIALSTLIMLLIPLLLLEGFYSGSEIALLSADKLALKRQARHGLPGAKIALDLASHPDRVLSTTLLMTSICVITISALVAIFFLSREIPRSDLISILITSPLVVIFGELLPKTLYRRNSAKLARWIAPPVSWTFWAFYPVTKILSSYTSYLARLAGPIEELMTG